MDEKYKSHNHYSSRQVSCNTVHVSIYLHSIHLNTHSIINFCLLLFKFYPPSLPPFLPLSLSLSLPPCLPLSLSPSLSPSSSLRLIQLIKNYRETSSSSLSIMLVMSHTLSTASLIRTRILSFKISNDYSITGLTSFTDTISYNHLYMHGM